MHNRIVLVNSTPIIALASIHKLKLLMELYGEIIIPKAVHDEVVVKKDSVLQLARAGAKDWIITKIIANSEAKANPIGFASGLISERLNRKDVKEAI